MRIIVLGLLLCLLLFLLLLFLNIIPIGAYVFLSFFYTIKKKGKSKKTFKTSIYYKKKKRVKVKKGDIRLNL